MSASIFSSWWGGSSPAPAVQDKGKEGSACPYDPTDPKQNPLNPKGLKPCCACPETKSARDACFLNAASADEADDKCRELVRRHVECMRGLGFKV